MQPCWRMHMSWEQMHQHANNQRTNHGHCNHSQNACWLCNQSWSHSSLTFCTRNSLTSNYLHQTQAWATTYRNPTTCPQQYCQQNLEYHPKAKTQESYRHAFPLASGPCHPKVFKLMGAPSKVNLANYFTKHHSVKHVKKLRPLHTTEKDSPRSLQGCVELLAVPAAY